MTYRRFNIKADESVNDADAVRAVLYVVEGGRISGHPVEDTYCYHTRFNNNGVHVSASRTKAGHDTFWVYREDTR